MSTAVVDRVSVPAQKAALKAIKQDAQTQKREQVDVPVNMIVRSPTNRQPVVTDDFLESIRKTNGAMQNVTLRPVKATAAHVTPGAPFAVGDTINMLVSGERRWIAHKKLGYATIPAVIRHLTDTEALELQISENKDRQDLNDMEKSRQYNLLAQQYIEDAHKAGKVKYGFKDAVVQIAERYMEGPRVVYETLQLKDLRVVAKERLECGWMTKSHAVRLCRRTHEEQEQLLLWLAGQAEHSHGELPSVRRLEREIELMDARNEDKKKQSQLFPGGEQKVAGGNDAGSKSGIAAAAPAEKPKGAVESFLARHPEAAAKPVQTPAPIGKVTFDGKTIDLVPGPLPESVNAELRRRGYPFQGGEIKSHGGKWPVSLTTAPNTFTVRSIPELQQMLTKNAHSQAPTRLMPDAPKVKPLSAAAQKKLQEQQEKQRELDRKRQLKHKRDMEIARRYDVKLFASLVRKLTINHRTLTRLIPDLLMQCHDDGDFFPALFAPQVLGWPEPEDGEADFKGDYSYQEMRAHAKKHTKKFTPGLLAALLLYNRAAPAEIERLAKSHSINPKKLREKAAAELKAERLRCPARPEDGKDRALYDYLTAGWMGKEWDKLRKKGATDAQVRELLCSHFGEWGSCSGPGKVPFTHKGTSNNPRCWFKSGYTGKADPDLAGAELVAKVRQLLNIEAV